MTGSAPAASWCVQVDLPADDVDEASGLLWASGVTSVQEIDLDGGRCRLVAGVDGEAAAREVRGALGDRWSVAAYVADYDGWLDAWRPFARPVRVGRIVVHPAWEAVDAAPGDVLVAIDAQRAFGQGNHPTTRLVLAALDAVLQPGDRVLDVGCGSGVLGIAAARLGAGAVRAVDIEDEAVAATRANAATNGVADRVEASSTPVEEVRGGFDVVLANILAPVLGELAAVIAARVAPGGALVLSGLLAGQRADVLAAYPGFAVTAERELEGWLALTLRRP